MAFTIAEDGTVVDPKVVVSYPAGVFDKVSLASISRWRFSPSRNSERPVPLQVYYTFSYKLAAYKNQENQYLKSGEWVKLEYTLQANGRPKDIVVIGQSSPSVSVGKAVEQLRASALTPILENGIPVDKQHQVVTIQ